MYIHICIYYCILIDLKCGKLIFMSQSLKEEKIYSQIYSHIRMFLLRSDEYIFIVIDYILSHIVSYKHV